MQPELDIQQSSEDLFANSQIQEMMDMDTSSSSMACPSPLPSNSISRAPSSIRSNKRKRDNQSADDSETFELLSQCRTLINAPIAPPQLKDQAACFADWMATKLRALDPRILSPAEMRMTQLSCEIENEQSNIVVLKPGQIVVENVIIDDNNVFNTDSVSATQTNSNEIVNNMTTPDEFRRFLDNAPVEFDGAEQPISAVEIEGTKQFDVTMQVGGTFEYDGPRMPKEKRKLKKDNTKN